MNKRVKAIFALQDTMSALRRASCPLAEIADFDSVKELESIYQKIDRLRKKLTKQEI
uniref:Uncharacterized protein n=1 Tax=viral metagenome TaxID=1070528 RepID=A0A6H1ZKP1_9ZZZZ